MSFSFSAGISTVLMPPRCAASTFSLSPPIGSTRPRSVISPVIARSWRTGIRVSAETSAVAIVMPADGPSFGIAPFGHVNVDVDLLVEVALEPELLGARAHVAHRRLRRLLHHVAERR